MTHIAVDTLIFAKWIIPVVPEGVVLREHAVAVTGSKITDILPAADAANKYQGKNTFHLNDHVLMPGLINAHGHAAMNLFKGLADDLPLMVWLGEHIWPAESKWVSEKFVADGTLLAITEMLRTGTTFFSDMYFYPNIAAEVASQHKIRTQVCFPVLDFPTNWASDADSYIHKGIELFDKYRNSDFVHTAFGPHAPYTVSDEPLKKIVTLSEQLNANIQIHLHETAFEVEDAVAKTGVRPIQRLYDLGLMSPALQCVHMTQISNDDLKLVTESGAHVIHCPESNLKLASGYCPVQKLTNAGVNVAIGTDGAASNNNLDMLAEIKTTALIGKAVANDASAVSAAAALSMATINGATAMGLAEKTGSLICGKWADMIAIDFSPVYHQPVYDPISHVVYSASGADVSHNWIGGQLHLKEKELTKIDIVHLKARVNEWVEKIGNKQ